MMNYQKRRLLKSRTERDRNLLRVIYRPGKPEDLKLLRAIWTATLDESDRIKIFLRCVACGEISGFFVSGEDIQADGGTVHCVHCSDCAHWGYVVLMGWPGEKRLVETLRANKGHELHRLRTHIRRDLGDMLVQGRDLFRRLVGRKGEPHHV